MSTPPRRRRPDARKSTPEGGGWLPTIAMGVGVIVAGLGIGALVAVLMQRNTTKQLVPVVYVTSTPAPLRTPGSGPIAIATIEPPRTPRPAPSPAESPSPAPSLEPTVAPTPSVPASSTPSPVASAAPSASPTRAALAVAVPVGTPAPSRIAVVTPAPSAAMRAAPPDDTPEPTAAPAAPATHAPTPASTPLQNTPPATPSAYDEHASAVVRQYLDALIRGDEKAAYNALGGSGGTLSEQSFLDPSARIVSLKVTRIDASNASVGCEIAAAKGHYYATYHVTAASSGPYISQHDYIKV